MGTHSIVVCLILGLNTFGFSNTAEKKEFCTKPDLKDGYIDRDPPTDDSIYYSCKTGYKPFFGNWWGAATCNNGLWLNEPQCIQKEECGVLPNVQHGQIKKTNAGQTAEIVCDPGFKPLKKIIRCNNGRWETPICEVEELSCVSPTRVENAVIISKPQERYSSGTHVTYKCHRNFIINGKRDVFCKNSAWDKAPTCKGSICPSPPLIEDGDYIILDRIGEIITEVSYVCQSYYVLNKQKSFYRCQGGRWETPPRCLKPCKFTPEIYEEYNIQPVPYVYIQHSDEEIELDCKKGWNVGGWKRSEYVKVKCSDGKITINKKCDTENILPDFGIM